MREDARSLSPTAQAALRRRAVRAVTVGQSVAAVAELLGVSRQAVYDWRDAQAHGGAAALAPRRRGRPVGTQLDPAQAKHIIGLLRDQRPEQLKLPFYLWTREAVVQLMARQCRVKVSVWTAGRYLKAWGFTPQKPVRRAFERDPQAVARWLKAEYPAIRRAAKRAEAEIYWGDEMGLRSDHTAGRSYSPRGKTPVIPGTGQRFGCNQLSALTNRGTLFFMVFKRSFKVRVFLEFLQRLDRQVDRPMFFIVDGHPVHRARAVKAWLAEPERRVKLFFLPGYSPELNPDELLNPDVKSHLGKRRPHTQRELIHTLRSHLRRRQRQPHIVRNFFQEKHVRYAAA